DRGKLDRNAIEFCRVFSEQLATLAQRKLGHRALELAVEIVPATLEAVDGKIGREHASVNPENADGVENDGPVGGQRPWLAPDGQPRDLAPDVWTGCQRLHAAAPDGERFRRAI